MKRVLWMVLLTLALPVAAFANDVDFSASGSGTLSGGNSGLILTGESIDSIVGLTPTHLLALNLASISFATGAFVTGSAMSGGTFGSGGSFTITAGTGIPGIASGTTIFTGTFTCSAGPCDWNMASFSNGTHQYTLTAPITGTWYTGNSVTGMTSQITINTGTAFFDGSVPVISGDTSITTPEPGSLMLMGTGLVGLGGVLRRKLKA
jgi:hypothetical protein